MTMKYMSYSRLERLSYMRRQLKGIENDLASFVNDHVSEDVNADLLSSLLKRVKSSRQFCDAVLTVNCYEPQEPF